MSDIYQRLRRMREAGGGAPNTGSPGIGRQAVTRENIQQRLSQMRQAGQVIDGAPQSGRGPDSSPIRGAEGAAGPSSPLYQAARDAALGGTSLPMRQAQGLLQAVAKKDMNAGKASPPRYGAMGERRAEITDRRSAGDFGPYPDVEGEKPYFDTGAENQRRIDELTARKESLQKRIRDLQYSGTRTFTTATRSASESLAEQIKRLQGKVKDIDGELSSILDSERKPAQDRINTASQQYYALQRENVQYQRSRGVMGKPKAETKEESQSLKREMEAGGDQRKAVEYEQKYRGKSYADDFGGQFGANMTLGRLSQDEYTAWDAYLSDPTPEKRAYAEKIGQVAQGFSERNQETLADDGTLPWISKSLAGYLPQLWDQTKAQVGGGLGGAALGLAVGNPAAGAKIGAIAGSGAYSYSTMRGAAFKGLLDLGVDEETARKAAKDEALISSLIEMADTGVDLATLGVGNLIDLLTRQGVKGAAKALAGQAGKEASEGALRKVAKLLGRYGLNIVGEAVEEYTQEGVSIANERRATTGGGTGPMGLAKDTWDVLHSTEERPEDSLRMNMAGAEGAKIAAMVGGGTILGTEALNTTLRQVDPAGKSAVQVGAELRRMDPGAVEAVISEGLGSDPATASYQLAREMKTKLDLGGRITDRELGVLYGANVQTIQAEEARETQKTASQGEAAGYRAVTPENVELPTVPIINLSMGDVAALNGGVLPDSGGYLRKTTINRAKARLGLDENSAAYIPASNVLRNGEEYVLKITKASLSKMFSPSDGSVVSPETVAVLENLERIANNGVYFRSEGDRKGRDAIQGIDHLMTTVYIDSVPYIVDMRVRIVQRQASDLAADNVLYYLTPEAITTVKKVDSGTPAAGRHASDGEAPLSSNTTLTQAQGGVKSQYTRDKAGLPIAPYVKEGTTASEMDTDQAAPIRTSETPEPVLPSNMAITQEGPSVKTQDAQTETAVSPIGRYGQKAFETVFTQAQKRDPMLARKGVLKAFTRFYEAGQVGLPLDKVETVYGAVLSREERFMAYMAGGNDAGEAGSVDTWVGPPYNGGKKEGGIDGRGEKGAVDLRGVHGADVWGEAAGTDSGRADAHAQVVDGIPEAVAEAPKRVPGWAQGHIIERSGNPAAVRAAQAAGAYITDTVIVEDHIVKQRGPKALAVTSGGTICLSDAIPADLANVVGYHEVVHAVKQRGDSRYAAFLSDMGGRVNFQSESLEGILSVVLEARFEDNSIFDLDLDQMDTLFDELNAVVWGFYKADPENARARFGDVFTDYNAYISELDDIIEGHKDREGPGPESSVGAASMGFDPWSNFQNQKSRFHPEGADAARPVDVPTTDLEGRPVSKSASTVLGARAIPDDALPPIQEMIMNGELSYEKKGDKAALEAARRTIERKGWGGALEELRSAVQKGQVSKDLAALAQVMLNNAANTNDGDAMAQVLTLYRQMNTQTGQALQAMSMFRKLSPESQLYGVMETVGDLEEVLRKKYKDKAPDLTIDPDLIEKFRRQTDQEGREAVMEEIYQNAADQIPATWMDKWNAWRYLAMLANPQTHVRNIGGNVFFQPLRVAKNEIAAAIEFGVSKATGGKIERTKAFLADPALYQAAWGDFETVRAELSGNRYQNVKSEIEDRRRIFQGKKLEAARVGNSWLLEAEDAIFKRITYADSLAGYLAANKVTAQQLMDGEVDPALLRRARNYAGQEALKATYQDRNAASDFAANLGRSSSTPGVVRGLVEGVLPFRRTPANILVRGVEYSPVGLLKSLTVDLAKVKQGKLSAAQAIDNISAGMAGSALFALGFYLFAQGVVTSGGGDDEGEDAMNELTGVQRYALRLPGGGNVTLDWLAPESMPFFMGVEFMDSIGENGWSAESVWDALGSIANPVLEMSMLQSLNDLIDSVSYAESTGKLSGLAGSALISYFTQGIPTVGGQIERTAEDQRVSTYTDKSNKLIPTDVQYALGRASARIPGWDYQQVPYIDAWGRTKESGGPGERAVNNFLNPAYTSKENITPVDQAILELYQETGEGGVIPKRPPRYVTIDGERVDLDAEQYVEYATQRGQTAYDLAAEMLKRQAYQRLDATERTQAIEDIYTYANQTALSDLFPEYEPASWVSDLDGGPVEPWEYILFKLAYDKCESQKKDGKTVPGSKQAAVISALENMKWLTDRERGYLFEMKYPNSEKNNPWR